jgi:aspartyl-tRNA(Asn)/glutamyl-tRNA(Gln) amidotransferase subunit B
MRWEPVIGIEVHVELATDSKMFCGCAVSFGAEPNTNVCPTCLGLPGALPVPNSAALDAIIAIGLALNCTVSPKSVFHRKNYFYADLPKNYQISHFDVPVCVDGYLDIPTGDGSRRVGIERAHMEEDTGKSTHLGGGGRIDSAQATLLDFNRSGVPLVEVVSRPEIHSAVQARAYAQGLREIVAELGVSDVRLEEGSLRFDANISIRQEGDEVLGTKVEIKNMNSFRSLELAVAYEIERQIELVESGGVVVQETRHWDEEAAVTISMRTKEGSSDYRYFAEPDLTPMEMSQQWVSQVRNTLPELPDARRSRYETAGVGPSLAEVLSSAEPPIRKLFDAAVAAGAAPRAAANWLTGEVTAWSRRTETDLNDLELSGSTIAELLSLVESNTVSPSAAKEVLDGVLRGEGDPLVVAEARDLLQISDAGPIESAIDETLAANPDAFESLQGGEEKVLGFLVGQVMRATSGKADPKLVNELLRSRAGI